MRIPERLTPLVEQGVIQEVLRPLMSGKEAEVFLVVADGEHRVAKVYKDVKTRSFKHRAAYTEGRKVRNTRQQRAMAKRSKFGREQEESAWRSAEVDAIYRLQAAGVRVPVPYDFVDGVLVMELITGPDGEPAPRLVDLELTEDEAHKLFQACLREVVKMLCAGLVHGDLSDFNVLMGPKGPVIIDFPQAVNAAQNNNARSLLIRDVSNLQSFLARYAPNLKRKRYGQEMWALYQDSKLHPETKLTGRFKGSTKAVDTQSILDEIAHAAKEELRRREELGLPPPRTRAVAAKPAPVAPARERKGRGGKNNKGDRDARGAKESRGRRGKPPGGGNSDRGPKRGADDRRSNARGGDRRDKNRSGSKRGDAPQKDRPPKRTPSISMDDLDALLLAED